MILLTLAKNGRKVMVRSDAITNATEEEAVVGNRLVRKVYMADDCNELDLYVRESIKKIARLIRQAKRRQKRRWF